MLTRLRIPAAIALIAIAAACGAHCPLACTYVAKGAGAELQSHSGCAVRTDSKLVIAKQHLDRMSFSTLRREIPTSRSRCWQPSWQNLNPMRSLHSMRCSAAITLALTTGNYGAPHTSSVAVARTTGSWISEGGSFPAE